MMDKIERLKQDIEKAFPFAKVKTENLRIEEDKNIKYWLRILNVPDDRLYEVKHYAIKNAIDLYEDEPLPFCVCAVNPEDTRKYFIQDDIIHSSNILFAPVDIPLVNLGIYGGSAVLSQGWAEVSSPGWVPLGNISIPIDAQPVIDKLGTYVWGAVSSHGWAEVASRGWVLLDNASVFINTQPHNEEITEETSFVEEEKLSLAA